MTHPLQDLDGARRHIFTANGQDFFLRVITSQEKFRERQDIINLVASRIMLEAQRELQSELDRRGDRGRVLEITNGNPTSEVDLEARGLSSSSYNLTKNVTEEDFKKYQNDFPNCLGNESSGTIFAVENAAQEPLCAIYLTINDRARREELQVGNEVGNFVYVDSIMTSPAARGNNIFSSAFDKIITMLAKPERHEGSSQSFQYAISVTAATELQNDGNQFYHIMNLPRYHKMWNDRFEDLSLMQRWQNKGTGKQHAEGNPINFAGDYNEQAMSNFIANQREAAEAAGERVRGVFLSGIMSGYEVAQEKREDLMRKREDKGIARNKNSEPGKGWEKPQATAENPQATNLDQLRLNEQNQGRT